MERARQFISDIRPWSGWLLGAAIVGLAASVALRPQPSPRDGSGGMLLLTSPSITEDAPLATRFTCGAVPAFAPALQWHGVPLGTSAFAIVARTRGHAPSVPDARDIRWMIWNIPVAVRSLPEAPLDDATRFPPTGASALVLRSACAPESPGPRRYGFEVYALDSTLAATTAGAPESALAAIATHALDRAEVVASAEH